MILYLTSTASGVGQLITVLLIFVFVLFITFAVTKWIANYQKDKANGENIEIIETKRIATNKLVEIVRIGDKYFALAIGKDEIETIGEINKDSIQRNESAGGTFSFKDFLEKAKDTGEDKS